MLKRSNYNNIEKLTKKKFQVKDKMVFENLIKAKAKKSGQKKRCITHQFISFQVSTFYAVLNCGNNLKRAFLLLSLHLR
jgi:hypothetical protein